MTATDLATVIIAVLALGVTAVAVVLIMTLRQATDEVRRLAGELRADVQATMEDWRGVVTAQGGHDNFIAISMVPVASSAPYDVYYFGVHGSTSDYTSRMTGTLTSDAGQMQTGKWNDIQRCESSLWFGRQVITAGM